MGPPAPRSFGWIVAIVLIVSAFMSGEPARAAPGVTIGGPFSLTASDGTRVTDRTYQGKWLLVYFGYTSCPDSCPTALHELAVALAKLDSEAAKVEVVFITIDPQRDTPERLGEYVRSFDARMVGLTGTAREIEAVTRAYGAYFVRHDAGSGSQDYQMDHSIYIYLMGPAGPFVRAFDATASADRIASAVRAEMRKRG